MGKKIEYIKKVRIDELLDITILRDRKRSEKNFKWILKDQK